MGEQRNEPVTAALSGLLGWAGLGSWIGRGWHPQSPGQRIRSAGLVLFFCLLAYAALLPWGFSRLTLLADGWRIAETEDFSYVHVVRFDRD